MHGWIVIDKPVGPGSTDVVSKVKRALRTGGYPKFKVGHGGTLDPLASGVLPIAIGEATKLCGRMLDSDKVYEFTIGFGVETDTLDGEGQPAETSDVRPTLAQVEALLPAFTGPIEQIPPIYSALKIDGKRAYDRARAGEVVEMTRRAVTVHALEIEKKKTLAQPSPAKAGAGPASLLPPSREDEGLLSEITLIASVSKGTYIRSLARDIARALGTVGHVVMLRRTKAGPFTLDGAISLDTLAELGHGAALEQALLPIEAGLDDIPALHLTPDQARLLRMGQIVVGIAAQPGLHFATDGAVPVALVEVQGPEIRVVRGFNL
jgi:tRNA pseudouridine55 synthase